MARMPASGRDALAEVGRAPTIEILAQQPGWSWWMVWAGMGGGRRGAEAPDPMRALVNDPRSWSLSDPGYVKAITPLRKASGLPPVPPAPAPPMP
jgi:hypothetical protein